MSSWVRTTKSYVDRLPSLAFPFESLPEIYVPQSTVLELPGGQRATVYQYCYLQRFARANYTEIDLTSLSRVRVEAMPQVVDRLSKWFRFGGARPQTMRTAFKALSQFMLWADSPEQAGRYEHVLTNADVALRALQDHHTFLRQALQAHRFSAATAGARDQRVVKILSEIHRRNFLNDIEPLSETRSRGVCAPRDDEVAAFMSILQAIFDSAAELAQRQPGDASSTEAGQRMLRIWASDDSKVVMLANDFSEARLMELACVAFAGLAIGDSGANLAQIQNYEEPDDLDDQLARPDRVNLTHKSIKLRAGGKPVPIHLTTTTLSRLRAYLQIRERLRVHLGSADVGPMFVQCAYGGIKGRAGRKPVSLCSLPGGFLALLRNKVRLIGAELPRVTLKQLRAYKQQEVVRKRGLRVAADVMGHSIVTAVRAYSNSQEDVQRSDMGQFLASLSSRVLESTSRVAGEASIIGIPPGSCSDHGNPVALEPEPIVEPDCNKTEGCFFCAKYKVHADAQDCRKLISCRYVLLKLAPLQGESGAADRVYAVVTDRIRALLEEVRRRAPEVYEQARQEVEVRHTLTRFWAVKLQQLFCSDCCPRQRESRESTQPRKMRPRMDPRVSVATEEQSGDASNSAAPSYFDANMVVSRGVMGEPVSRYGDSVWNCSAQSTDGTSGANLHFFELAHNADSELATRTREQHKALMWLYIDAGKVRALKTVQLANYTLSALCDRASARCVSVFELLIDPELVEEELGSLPESYLDATSTLIKTLWRHRTALNVDDVPLNLLKARIAAVRKGRPPGLQTPLIPSRIYCVILAGLITGLDEIERDLESLLNAYRENAAASLTAPAVASPGQHRAFRANMLAPTVERMKNIGYEPLKVTLSQFIVGRLNMYQSQLMHTVAAFSGMRVGEVCILPLQDVIETFEERGALHYVVKGYTHKLNGGIKRPTSWITSREGNRAILLAQRIASTTLEVLGGQPTKGQEALLFPSTESPFRRKNTASVDRYQRLLVEAICPVIMKEDMDELDRLELDRGWQRKGIEVGNRWPLAFHQLRRSLSVYAHRSGMVSLPALKAQLQHITDEMRAYYANGYSRAVNLVWDKDHISKEWEAAKAESSYFGYSLGLLFSDDDLILLGRGADRMANTISTRSREETLQLFRNGKLAYRETVLGGCVSVEECRAMPLEPVPIQCLKANCVNQMVLGKRLDHVIRTQETVVATLERDESGSVEHRLEAGHMQVLLNARQQLVKRAA